jgi:hypothetical protein
MPAPKPVNPEPDDFQRELLAAYADGELDDESRAQVEQWLAEHPEALAELEAQRQLSPTNVPLWERAEPTEPSSAVWAAVRNEIEEELDAATPLPLPGKRWRIALWTIGGLAAGVAAAVAWVVFTPNAPQPLPGKLPMNFEVVKLPAVSSPELAPLPRMVESVPPTLIDGMAVLPMATDADVILERVPDTGTGWLPVGKHPFSGLMVLASAEEVQLEEVEPSPVWPVGGPKMTTAPGDAPMIYAAKLR